MDSYLDDAPSSDEKATEDGDGLSLQPRTRIC